MFRSLLYISPLNPSAPMADDRFHTSQSFIKQVTIPSHSAVRCSVQHTSHLIITLLQHELIWKRLPVQKELSCATKFGNIFAHYSEGFITAVVMVILHGIKFGWHDACPARKYGTERNIMMDVGSVKQSYSCFHTQARNWSSIVGIVTKRKPQHHNKH